MTESATGIFDNHPLWEELDSIDAWLSDISDEFGPNYSGLPGLASEFLHRIDTVVEVTRLYLGSAVKEAVSKAHLDGIKTPLTQIYVELQGIKLDEGSDYDQSLADANEAADQLLSSLYKLRSDVPVTSKAKITADENERNRVTEYLNSAQSIVEDLTVEIGKLKQKATSDSKASQTKLTELNNQIEEVSESFTEQIETGVEAGKQRIDDQIETLQKQYTSEIEEQRKQAQESVQKTLEQIQKQKQTLEGMIEETKQLSGYVAENAMSRLFEERADDSKRLWIRFIWAGGIVTVISVFLFWLAGNAVLESSATGEDIVRGVVRAIMGIGSAGLAAYLFKHGSIQQRIYQDFRSAEVRLGSLDAFLARFDESDAQEIRRGVGKRVYIDGELGEIASATPKKQEEKVSKELSASIDPEKTESEPTNK